MSDSEKKVQSSILPVWRFVLFNPVCIQTRVLWYLISLHNLRRVLNKLVCRCGEKKKKLMANEIAGFGGLNLFYLVIMSELTIECVNSLCS